jgi:SAM-dependent methyltransferase
MSEPSADFNPRRFRTTVPYYARYRLPYPELLIRRAIERVGLVPGDSVMDLGCGPGLLAIPFARAGMKVTAIDPEPEMLAQARAAAEAAEVAIDVRQGSSFELPPGIGPFKLVTMGRAFHWMDRQATLKTLDGLVSADGAVGFFDDDHPDTMENAWRRALRDVGNRYGREDTAHLRGKKRPDYRCRESLLLDSAFSAIEACVVFIRREITVDEILGLAFSLSTSSPEALGERLPEFERELRAALAELSPEGKFTEIAQLEAQIAKRV